MNPNRVCRACGKIGDHMIEGFKPSINFKTGRVTVESFVECNTCLLPPGKIAQSPLPKSAKMTRAPESSGDGSGAFSIPPTVKNTVAS